MKNFKGTFTALITPFKNQAVDFASLDRLIKHQLENGVDGFVIARERRTFMNQVESPPRTMPGELPINATP